jgi:hypothetical protein
MSDETTNEGVAGVGLLVAAYVDERGADNALEQLKQAKKAKQFYYDDAAVVRRSAEGKVHVKETGDMSTGKGAAIGGLVGGVIGLLAGPVGWAVLGGAAVGAIAAHGRFERSESGEDTAKPGQHFNQSGRAEDAFTGVAGLEAGIDHPASTHAGEAHARGKAVDFVHQSGAVEIAGSLPGNDHNRGLAGHVFSSDRPQVRRVSIR